MTLSLPDSAGPLPMSGEGLRIVLGQLLRNATEHGAARVTFEVQAGPNAEVTLIVRDDGRGISAGNAGRIFEPFFTTRRDGGGTGMGLSIVRNILAAHRAGIGLVPQENGACFRIVFAPAG